MWIKRTSHSTLKIYTIHTNNPQLRIDLRYICILFHSRWRAIKYVGGLYTGETTGNKSQPRWHNSLNQLHPPPPKKKETRPSYECKPLRAYTHMQRQTVATQTHHILWFNCNKSFSCFYLFPYPPSHPTVIQEITWIRNVGIGSVPIGCIRIYCLLPTCY
jgi:hypothetical protein